MESVVGEEAQNVSYFARIIGPRADAHSAGLCCYARLRERVGARADPARNAADAYDNSDFQQFV
jgi:hypothetical protein